MESKGTPIFFGGRCVGVVVAGVFYRDAHDGHFLRTPPAIAFHDCILQKIKEAGAVEFAITAIDRQPMVIYRITAAQFDARRFGPFDRIGTGAQYGVVLGDWRAELAAAGTPGTPAEAAPPL